LKRLIKKNGLLDRQPAYYTGKTVFTLGLLAVSLALLFVLGETWFQLLNAAYLATLIFGNLLLGLSRRWWIDKHNDHHGHPNQLDVTPT
jgi:hypothetical protein